MIEEWSDPARVADYLRREIPHRGIAEKMLSEALPQQIERFLDLGTGDGRLLDLIRAGHPVAAGVGVDSSTPMLERARERFEDDDLIELSLCDLADPLLLPRGFDVVVSGLAIHHLEDERKRELFGEVYELLNPGGVFMNLDLVAPATQATHERFRRAIGRMQDDPSDRLAGLCEQMSWLGAAGFEEVDCHFKWLELTLVIARRA